MTTLEQINRDLEQHAPALWQCLSPMARASVYPPDIPFQAAQARGKRYNGTIGQITDGVGHILALPVMAESLSAFSGDDLNQALLYSPIGGLPELRELWHEFQRPAGARPSSLPIVTVGLTHGLSLTADLFGGPSKTIVVPTPYWGNYRQVFALRTGARILEVDSYDSNRQWRPTMLGEAMAELPDGEPVVAILNLPSNPGGYSPSDQERLLLVDSLVEAAARRPIVVVCDDAYAGLVYDDDIDRTSIFWQLLGRHESLFPIRVAGSTKEFTFFGGRVGFLTFPFDQESPVAQALDNKARCLLRATVGSPVAVSQVLLLRALRAPDIEQQIADNLGRLKQRWQVLTEALADVDPEILAPLPCNSGVFTLLEIPPGLDPDRVRHHLLDHEDTGVVSVRPKYLRIAFCSVKQDDLPELVRRVARGVRACLEHDS